VPAPRPPPVRPLCAAPCAVSRGPGGIGSCACRTCAPPHTPRARHTPRPRATQVAASELRLADTIASLGGLEAAAAGFAACSVAPRPGAGAAAAADLAEAPVRALERAPKAPAPAPAPAPRRRRGGPEARRRGLHSSLDPPARLREFWFPAAFSAKLGRGAAVPFELLGEPWVLFRDADGAPACVRDECAHRACPLSLARARRRRLRLILLPGSALCLSSRTPSAAGVGRSRLDVLRSGGVLPKAQMPCT